MGSRAGVAYAAHGPSMTCTEFNRRRMLYGVGTIIISSIAGCTESTNSGEEEATNSSRENEGTNDSPGQEDTNESTNQIDPSAEVDEYLSDANLYDGTVRDRVSESTIEVNVGAGENGLAFDPPAVRVSPNTEITWTWTGEGGAHNVVSEPTDGNQNRNESDQHHENESEQHAENHGHTEEATLNSGDPEDGADITYTETLSEPATVLYHCHPHKASGMKGAVIVSE